MLLNTMFSGAGCLQITSYARDILRIVKDGWGWKGEAKRNSRLPPMYEASPFTTIISCPITPSDAEAGVRPRGQVLVTS